MWNFDFTRIEIAFLFVEAGVKHLEILLKASPSRGRVSARGRKFGSGRGGGGGEGVGEVSSFIYKGVFGPDRKASLSDIISHYEAQCNNICSLLVHQGKWLSFRKERASLRYEGSEKQLAKIDCRTETVEFPN